MKSFFSGLVVSSALFALLGAIVYITGSGEGIHPIGSNAVIIEGECTTLNWDISEEDIALTLTKLRELRK
jgi:hypothetical protein